LFDEHAVRLKHNAPEFHSDIYSLFTTYFQQNMSEER
jgi:hypothetical protein